MFVDLHVGLAKRCSVSVSRFMVRRHTDGQSVLFFSNEQTLPGTSEHPPARSSKSKAHTEKIMKDPACHGFGSEESLRIASRRFRAMSHEELAEAMTVWVPSKKRLAW